MIVLTCLSDNTPGKFIREQTLNRDTLKPGQLYISYNTAIDRGKNCTMSGIWRAPVSGSHSGDPLCSAVPNSCKAVRVTCCITPTFERCPSGALCHPAGNDLNLASVSPARLISSFGCFIKTAYYTGVWVDPGRPADGIEAVLEKLRVFQNHARVFLERTNPIVLQLPPAPKLKHSQAATRAGDCRNRTCQCPLTAIESKGKALRFTKFRAATAMIIEERQVISSTKRPAVHILWQLRVKR